MEENNHNLVINSFLYKLNLELEELKNYKQKIATLTTIGNGIGRVGDDNLDTYLFDNGLLKENMCDINNLSNAALGGNISNLIERYFSSPPPGFFAPIKKSPTYFKSDASNFFKQGYFGSDDSFFAYHLPEVESRPFTPPFNSPIQVNYTQTHYIKIKPQFSVLAWLFTSSGWQRFTKFLMLNSQCQLLDLNPNIYLLIDLLHSEFKNIYSMQVCKDISLAHKNQKTKYIYAKEYDFNAALANVDIINNFAFQFRFSAAYKEHQKAVQQFVRTPDKNIKIMKDYVAEMYRKPDLIDCYQVCIQTKIQNSLYEMMTQDHLNKLQLLNLTKIRQEFIKKLQNKGIFTQIKGYFWNLEYDYVHGFIYRFFIFLERTRKCNIYGFDVLLRNGEFDSHMVESRVICPVSDQDFNTMLSDSWLKSFISKRHTISRKKLYKVIDDLYESRTAAHLSTHGHKKIFFGRKEIN